MTSNINVFEIVTVEFPINSEVLAQQFGNFISAIDELYYAALWLDRAELYQEGVFPDNNFGPEGLSYEDYLWIDAVSIGTPNRARFRGKRKPLITVALIINMITGAKDIAHTAKTVLEIRDMIENRREIIENQIDIKSQELKPITYEIAEKDLALIDKTRSLHESGQVSKEALDYKQENLPQATKKIEQCVDLLDSTRKTIIARPQ